MAEDTPEPVAISRLYSELVLRHNREPHGFGVLATANRRGEAENRSCGDQVLIALQVDADGIIRAAQFEGESCAICTAAASILCQTLTLRTLAQARGFLHDAEVLIQTGSMPGVDLGELAAFAELKQVPARRRCALLPVSAAMIAVQSDGQ